VCEIDFAETVQALFGNGLREQPYQQVDFLVPVPLSGEKLEMQRLNETSSSGNGVGNGIGRKYSRHVLDPLHGGAYGTTAVKLRFRVPDQKEWFRIERTFRDISVVLRGQVVLCLILAEGLSRMQLHSLVALRDKESQRIEIGLYRSLLCISVMKRPGSRFDL
jgi:hypothetical protein